MKFANCIIIFMYHMHRMSMEKGKKLFRDQLVFPEEDQHGSHFVCSRWKQETRKSCTVLSEESFCQCPGKINWIPPSRFQRQRSRNSSVSSTNCLFAICHFLPPARQVLFHVFVQKLLLASGNKGEGTWYKLVHYGLKCSLRQCS